MESLLDAQYMITIQIIPFPLLFLCREYILDTDWLKILEKEGEIIISLISKER